MFKNMWYFLALCIMAASAENDNSAKTKATSTVSDKETPKVEPTNISALYIGDLLRTKPKEVLEAAGSVYRPLIYDKSFQPAASVPDRTLNYRVHGGQEYLGTEYSNPATQSKVKTIPIALHEGRSVPINVMGHLLTVKPVRVVKTVDARSLSEAHAKTTPHHDGDDCSKSGEYSYSSEEPPYATEQQTYRRAKQIAPDPEPEYRSHPSTYSEEDRAQTYSESDPSSYDSKSYPADTNSKSHSSGSYTKSKSSSTSKSVNPSRTRERVHRIVPTVLSHHHEKRPETSYGGGEQDAVVYKVKEPSYQRPSSYSENTEREYPPSSYDREHKAREPSYPKKSRKYSQGGHPQYSSSEPKESPQQYESAPYEQEKGTSPYSPPREHRYREHSKPSTSYHEEGYAHQPDTRGQEEQKPYYQSYKAPESTPTYEQPSKSQPRKKHRSSHYERPSSEGNGYRTREPAPTEYSYPQGHQLQSSRPKKANVQSGYASYSSQEPHTESSPTPQSYDRTHPALRPSEEKPINQYVYEATPHQQPEQHGSHKRQYREPSSSRPPRSPDKRMKSVIVEGRAHLSGSGNEPLILVSRESKPYVSRSESYSQNAHNVGINQSPKANYREFDPFQKPQLQQMDKVQYQTSYKPFNSEYPASYANDQHHNAEEQRSSHTYEPPHSYGSPVHSQTKSYSGEGPRQHQSYGEQPYEHDEDGDDDSHEQAGPPAKKGKNHHYISKIEGFKDTYGSHEPLTIDEEFFKKYGISPTAKVIVASVKKPNLFVADGTSVKEGEFFGLSGPSSGPSSGSGYGSDSGPSSGSSYGPSPGPSSGPTSEPSYGQSSGAGYGPSSENSEDASYEPDYKRNTQYNEDSYNESPEELGAPKELPGSFDDLVDTNPKFLRHLPRLLNGDESVFKMDSTEESFDDVEFPEEKKSYIVSQGPREIVQQHGDGVSRIIFNVPKGESKAESSPEEVTERIVAAATEALENLIKSDS